MMDKINNIQEVGGYLSYFFYVDESGVKKKNVPLQRNTHTSLRL